MKSVLFGLLFTSALAMSAADAPSVSGKWQIHNNIAGNESDMACSWTQKDNALTGECSSDHGPINITGKVDGKKVNWTYKSEYNGSPITLTYQGTTEAADKMSGSVTVEEYGAEGEFTATLSK